MFLRYHQFFDDNLPFIFTATTFSGSVVGGTIAYSALDAPVGQRNVWDYSSVGLGSCAGGIVGAIVGVLLEPIIIPCTAVAGTVCGVGKAYDTLKDMAKSS